jgi:hypothetical protein
MSLFLGLAASICVGLAIWGFVHHFPFHIIKGAMVNGTCLLVSAYALRYGVHFCATRGGVWWLLSILGLGFGYICLSNLRNYATGKEASEFNAEVRAAIMAEDD